VGLFATRSPHRPNGIGITTVNLLSVDGLTLEVKGLDAIDGTPVLDIKPYTSKFD
jgi:tRNA (Thr-GGU) A37 N-methylase